MLRYFYFLHKENLSTTDKYNDCVNILNNKFSRGKNMIFKHIIHHKVYIFALICFLSLSLNANATDTSQDTQNKYVGVDACVDCHQDIVNIFRTTSKKAHSDVSVKKMREKLTDAEYTECLKCHSTGYGQPSGFISNEATPHLAIVGCESCHGMGYLHTLDGSKETITRTPTLELCITCHDDSKVERISYDGRIHAGGH